MYVKSGNDTGALYALFLLAYTYATHQAAAALGHGELPVTPAMVE